MSGAGGIIKTYFLTGATGVVGSAIVPRLLLDPDTRVMLLIRAKDEPALQTRMGELIRFWRDSGEKVPSDRIEAVRGDATLPQFGLAEKPYSALEHECTHVIHSAGTVRMNLSLEDARRSAVGSATEILTLARRMADRGQLEKVEFVSTVGIAGKRAGALPETWIDEPREFHNTYEQAKAEAEDYVREEVEHGLPLTVHRPSMVVGDSRTGGVIHFQIFYHLCEFLSGLRTLGLSPNLGRAHLDTVPADYVGSAIAWSSRQPTTSGRVFHLCSGPQLSIPLTELQPLVRAVYAEAGRWTPPVIALPSWAFLGAMRALGLFVGESAQRAIRTLPVFIDYLTTEQAFGNAQSQESLVAAGIALPSPRDYLPCVLRQYLGSGEHDRKAGN